MRMKTWGLKVGATVLLAGILAGAVAAEERPNLLPNIEMRSGGGRYIWRDESVRGGWRVQTNVVTGHCRVLDPDQVRRAWSLDPDACRQAFAEKAPDANVQEERPLVFLVHGLYGSRFSMKDIESGLTDAGYAVIVVTYPSARGTIAEHAAQLNRIIDESRAEGSVKIVTHSMGGLVARQALAQRLERGVGARVEGLVMIAPPNKGSVLADMIGEANTYEWATGPSGQALTSDNARDIPRPHVPYCVVAGVSGNDIGFNPIVAGDDDGIVSLDETRLSEDDEIVTVQGFHHAILRKPETLDAVLRFLDTGRCAVRKASGATGKQEEGK